MNNYIDPGTSKGSALASFAVPSAFAAQVGQVPTLVTLAFIERDDEQGTIRLHENKHWGAAIEYGHTLYERPRVHQKMTKQKGSFIIASANDLIQLDSHGMHAAAFVAGLYPVRAVEPQVWKKQVAKCMHHHAAWEYLTPAETNLLAQAYGQSVGELFAYIQRACSAFGKTRKLTGYSSQIVDLLDAVCLGLWDNGRFRV